MIARIDFPTTTVNTAARERYAFSEPITVLRATHLGEVQPLLDAVQAYARQGYWCVGYVAYEAAPAFDPSYQIAHGGASEAPSALALFAVYAAPCELASPSRAAFTASPWTMTLSAEEFYAHAEALRQRMAAGECYQVNFTAPAHSHITGDGLALFEALQRGQNTGYCAYLADEDHQVLSVSPELFFRWHEASGAITTQPMKGTAPRDSDPVRDAAACDHLATSSKERAENLMIVDLLRNDLSRIADQVCVPEQFAISALPTVWQMTSTITAQTRAGVGLNAVFGALFPCGSITGAPKIKAMELIRQHETAPRGVYCGAIGLVRPDSPHSVKSSADATYPMNACISACFSVAIRTLVIQGQEAQCGVGSGLTWDADPQTEWQEWQHKLRFLARARAPFALLETMRYAKGEIQHWSRHRARLQAACTHFAYPWPASSIDNDVTEYLAQQCAAGVLPDPARLRLTLSAHGELALSAHPCPTTPNQPRFVLAREPVDARDEFLHYKTTWRAPYVHALASAPPDCFEVLLWNTAGELTEFTKGNLVLQVDGRLFTPPLQCGLLAGTYRAAVLDSGTVHERVLTCADLAQAQRIWFINSVRGWVEVFLAANHGPKPTVRA